MRSQNLPPRARDALTAAMAMAAHVADRPIPRNPIALGRNAGRLRPMNDVLLDRVTSVRTALIRIRNAGYHALGINLEGAKPTIELAPHADFRRLIEEDIACYYITRQGRNGAERVGQFDLDGVRFIWTERGNG